MRRAARWLLNLLLATIAGGLLWSLITIGAGIIASAVVATVTDMERPWQYVLAAGVFVFTVGIVGSLIRLGFLLIPNRWEKALTRRTGRRRTALPTPPSFLFPTPQQRAHEPDRGGNAAEELDSFSRARFGWATGTGAAWL
jgi:hypothetical protein